MLIDPMIRLIIRKMIAYRLQGEARCYNDPEYLNQFILKLKSSPVALRTDLSKKQHYEVPTEFFKNVMGAHLKYSCGMWGEGIHSLDESEKAMLDLYCERAQLRDGLSILDLGCGWGSLALYLAQKYPRSSVLAVSHSKTQKEYIEGEAHKRGIKNLKVQTMDMNDFHSEGSFDRILSIEMFEHMRNHEKLMGRLAQVAKPGALLFIHIFVHREFTYLFEKGWMAENFFSGGMMPAQNLLLNFQKDWKIESQWQVNGRHYEKTSNAWLKKMDLNLSHVKKILQSRRQVWKWRLFFMACAELFGLKDGQEYFVSHYLFSKK